MSLFLEGQDKDLRIILKNLTNLEYLELNLFNNELGLKDENVKNLGEGLKMMTNLKHLKSDL